MLFEGVELADVGGWALTFYKALQGYNWQQPYFEDYQNLVLAGRLANFASSLRSLGTIDERRFDVYRRLASINKGELPGIIAFLERTGFLTRVAEGYQFLDLTVEGVYELAARLLIEKGPTETEQAVVIALALTVYAPVKHAYLSGSLQKAGFTPESADRVLKDLATFDLLNTTAETLDESPLLYNPKTVASDLINSAHAALKSLTNEQQEQLLAIISHVRENPGVPIPERYGEDMTSLLAKLGIIDLSAVQLSTGQTKAQFPTLPGIWSSVKPGAVASDKDLADDSKLFLNSLRYGEIFSQAWRGRINSLSVLLSALVDRGTVGPATAIGSDYPLPLARGIVSIVESRLKPGRFLMELRKRDVAETVLTLIQRSHVPASLTIAVPDVLGTANLYEAPEQVRQTRPLPQKLLTARDSMIFDLRSYRGR